MRISTLAVILVAAAALASGCEGDIGPIDGACSACAAGEVEVDGACVPETCTPACTGGTRCLEGECVDPSRPCGLVTESGVCDGTRLTYCDGGRLAEEECTALGPACTCDCNPDLLANACLCR